MIQIVLLAVAALTSGSVLVAAVIGAMTGGAHASDDRTAPLAPPTELPLAERARRAHLEHVDRVRAAEALLDRAFSPPNPGRNP